jgi:heme exporter protein C
MISGDVERSGTPGNLTGEAGRTEEMRETAERAQMQKTGELESGLRPVPGTRWRLVLGVVTALALLGGAWMALFYAPTERVQGNAQRIFYFHVPLAWTAYLAFFVVLVGSIGYLWKRSSRLDTLALSSAEVGLVLTTLVLVTGSLWGKTVWGTWWSWDPRLTATLVLWFVYLGYGMVRQFAMGEERARRIAAVLGIVGFVDVPIVHQSVVWWRSLHPDPVVLNASGPQLPGAMLATLLVNLAAFTLLYIYMLVERIRVARLEDALAEKRRLAALDEV